MTRYLPATTEKDPNKINQSIQGIGSALETAEGTIVTNTTSIATNTAAIALLNAATYVNSFKARTGVVVPAQGDYPTSLIPGTATNDSATAGNIGEYVESVITSGTEVSMTTNTQKNITSISLTAGDWDVSAIAYHHPAATTSITRYAASVGTTTGAIDSTSGRFSDFYQAALVSAGGTFNNAIPPYRFSFSGTTTIFLVGLVTFTVSTLASYGLLRARRVR